MARSKLTPEKLRTRYAKRRKYEDPLRAAPEWTVVRRDVLELLEKHPEGLSMSQMQEKLSYHAASRVSQATRWLIEDRYIDRPGHHQPYRAKRGEIAP